MWIPSSVVGWFESFQKSAEVQAKVASQALQDLREELVAVRTERDVLKHEILSAKVNADWLRVKVNGLELEKAGLLQKAYNITLPVPEIVRTPQTSQPFEQFSFDDIGDEAARKLGLPTYDNR